MSKVSKEAQNTYKHVFAHNFLNIQQIFNPEKVLESWDLGLSNHIIKSYVCQRRRRWFELHCVCNAVYVGDVEDITKWVLVFYLFIVRDVRDGQITSYIIIQTIQIGKYFKLMLWITWNFELKLCINSN